MSFHYASRVDKNGNLLLTSYGNLKSAEKYGGADADITDTIYYANFGESLRRVSLTETPEEDNAPIVRSFLRNNSPAAASSEGRYELWGKIDGQWAATGFKFDSYGAGNTLMKSLISSYEALLLLDMGVDEAMSRERKSTPMDFSNL